MNYENTRYEKHWYRTGAITLGLALSSLLAGCGSLEKPFPDKTLRTISVGKPDEASTSHPTNVLRVNAVKVAKPFDGLTFVYKTGASTYVTDYYNGFIASPDLILTGELNNWLSESGLYSSVIGTDSGAESHLSLETNVTALYGDFAADGKPTALISARFFVVDYSTGKYLVTFQKEYSEAEPISSKSPDDLVKGWESGYRKMLTQLVADLSKSQ